MQDRSGLKLMPDITDIVKPNESGFAGGRPESRRAGRGFRAAARYIPSRDGRHMHT
jgi:hypothetical protein